MADENKAQKMNPLEMYNQLVQLGHITPSPIEPNSMMVPTAYADVQSTTAFFTPVIATTPEKKNAKLGTRSKGNRKRKG